MCRLALRQRLQCRRSRLDPSCEQHELMTVLRAEQQSRLLQLDHSANQPLQWHIRDDLQGVQGEARSLTCGERRHLLSVGRKSLNLRAEQVDDVACHGLQSQRLQTPFPPTALKVERQQLALVVRTKNGADEQRIA